ncbi:methionine ABC transporter ATP-binding protein [Limosilactobacillus fermentum]|uniref:methionine ABC transporter ATP-binding protein n=1 Tax=Limosilactobacillus fermentum TaxID=1613 RepID=UPI00040AAD2E|nr:methionine ABC transporter ATP-binding protein [Limosilactobacillus fermentum]ARA99906.1 methionine ABC transporter ATP-binding protein [Limosilactobacillus fermentum]MCH5386847.1 methionine ABC transporter ATP-binding protein [Limosilactobacillus fermentum]QSE65790.1 methionine ABC transporter ATP-binding protein [Limosilactobacillus fermentum]QSH33933.1 methionine ABC transporter ATP-binding protein [Limosilactobacillus fermentum]QSH35965.1 methionine ABC transporter ATP-binding protein [
MVDIISLDHIDVTFPQKKGEPVRAVSDVNLHVEKGDIYGVVGYSGAGKSTLVRTINLLQKPTEGTVTVGGTVLFKDHAQQVSNAELQAKRRNIGMIFQHFNLLNETTVVDNVLFALKHAKLKDKEAQEKALNLLELVGLKDKAQAFPVQLSGGEQQRVAIARALANDPEILISDEATSALDPRTTNQILDLLRDLNKKLGLTIVLITHEMEAVKRVANKIAVMQHGVIIEQGSLRDIYLRPKQELTRQFVGGSLAAIETLKAFNLGTLAANERLYQLVFSAKTVTKSIILELYRQSGVDVSMLYGNIEVLGDEPVGTLFVIVTGDDNQQAGALQFLNDNQVEVTQIDDRGIWND